MPGTHEVMWPHRAETGKFCHLNCFQEALAPILAHDHGIDTSAFSLLRFIGLPDLREPLEARADPGGFGGVSWVRLGELYRIRWQWLRQSCSEHPEAVGAMARHGPLIAIVDRYFMPTDHTYHRRHHRMHTILIVGAGEDGVAYSDAEYPFTPARISWATLGRAVLDAPDGNGSFLLAVEDCAELPGTFLAISRAAVLAALARSLRADAELIRELAALLLDELVGLAGDDQQGRLRGNDIASLLNGAGQSLVVAAQLLQAEPAPAAAATSFVQALTRNALAVYRLTQMHVESGGDRFVARLERELTNLVECWAGSSRQAALHALQDRLASLEELPS